MLDSILKFSLKNKLIIILFTLSVVGFGLYSLTQISIGAVPDVTNNQIQVISTSKNLATQDVEKFITYPVELEMANLPGVIEIRSVSKFGLSVVTVVFEDNMGTYLPRQLLQEKLKAAAEKIPEGYGTPEMGPITTGLGEIYQYTLEVEEAFQDNYSISDLRTIQDWIVKRQLSGMEGVVEINTWGGYLKQYEVALDMNLIKALDISIQEVFMALNQNNSVAGGGYIEKENQAYFVRGEGILKNTQDIENIVVTNRKRTPVLIKDIAKVQMGSAPRFGAITGNGEGEKVLGQIMMIKDGNSKKTLEGIHDRITEISKSLPEGVYINGFLDRSELIGKTTFTVEENLILGSLIVIFIVVLLLGNLRSGLIVASVIPLSLLFTISMMNIFGIDANLMSLGAIDFGIIIDGAVIIVEFVALKITQNSTQLQALVKNERQQEMDKITFNSSQKMMNSAIFGQLIILIVFIPILSLRGVEGKMFTPMALAFSFALIGAMILCFTYIPVISSLFLKPKKENPKSISSRIIRFLIRLYEPVITWALVNKKKVVVFAILIFASSVVLFNRMGGEFVPTLDEGDFVIQPVLKTGTSLSKTIEITTQIESILLDKFPEVEQVVSRIGAAEVPTDPMSMEESDVIIKLKSKNEWVSANSKDELADKFKEALLVIPGIDIEFTQPIEMRFNELITGVRSDVAVKIFGEDLDMLFTKANEIRDKISHVAGAADITVEKIDDLPQMSVNYKSNKIAEYGLNISDVNQMITAGFSGITTGSIFEGEKQFDLVVRLKDTQRNDINDLKNLWIDTPRGIKVPLSELAEITYASGPAKISRDDTKRRVVIGINVRNRDLQSVVDDVQKIIESEVKIPTGYSVAYGGQFENLKSAKARLSIALPVALILIFILLHFAFKSVKEALLVYTAIPLAAVGGVYLLWLRDLPFSISAGVGFIALFGIAVLNGIVLIEHFKELKKQGLTDMNQLIIKGTKERLRPVILTALAAALGFFPMAVSTNVGAEVQRPLATVVIGGLITSTLLTMIILPVLYAIFEKTNFKIKKRSQKNMISLIFLLLGLNSVWAQSPPELQLLIDKGIQNNLSLQYSAGKVAQKEVLTKTAFTLQPAHIYYNRDPNNLSLDNLRLTEVGIEQSVAFPTKYALQKSLLSNKKKQVELEHELLKNEISKAISGAYNEFIFLNQKELIYNQLDSLYNRFQSSEAIKFELGESNYLQKLTAQSKYEQIHIQLQQIRKDKQNALEELKYLTQDNNLRFSDVKTFQIEVQLQNFEQSNTFLQQQNLENLAKYKWKKEKQNWLPDFSFTFFKGLHKDLQSPLNGFQIGLDIPLIFNGYAKKSQVSKMALENQQLTSELVQKQWQLQQSRLLQDLSVLKRQLASLEYQKEQVATEILKVAVMGYENGELDFFDYLQSMENIKDIRLTYYETLMNYNNKVLDINYLK